jgi:exopolyphosphatase/guanosine-5'-triphosphate,3'-diphosphate pyrophosphatase
MIAEGLRARLGLRREDEDRHAVIDIGSNTVRLVVYGGPPRAPAVLWNEKVSARLGRDLARTGSIPPEAMDEALAALARFAIIVEELGIKRIETVATAAPRDATNGEQFIRRVEDLGLAVGVLSGEDEACASAFGAIGAFPGAEGVVADLGGGSLELVAVSAGACGQGGTFPLGTLRLPALRAAGHFDRKVAKLLKGADWARNPGPLYMIGGTWRAFATYTMRTAEHPLTDPHGLVIAAQDAAALAATLVRTRPEQLAKHRGISTMRAEKLPDAAALLRVLLTELKPEALVFSSWGLREGLYFQSLSASERAQDPLLAGVAEFAGRRGIGDADARLIADWTAAAARTDTPRMADLRLAAAHLAVALHRVEPNLRAAQALEWALDKRWIGIDFAGRAMLAAALRGSLNQVEPHPRFANLASEGELREATAWGLSFRLAQRLAAGARAPLLAGKLAITASEIELRLAARHAALASNPVEKDLAALASWLGGTARLVTAL